MERYSSEKDEEKVYKSYVKSAMLYKGKTWSLTENKVTILRVERLYREGNVWCKVGGQEEYSEADEHVNMKEAADKLASMSGVRWYGHVLRRPEENF